MKKYNKNKIIAELQRIRAEASASAKTEEARERIDNMQIYDNGYAEPGYEGKIIVLGNFNKISRYNEKTKEFEDVDNSPSDVAEKMQKAGAELEWEDEWVACYSCGKLARTQPDSYGWQRSYWDSPDGALCHECIKENPTEYLASLEGNPKSCITLDDLDPLDHDYVLLKEGYENGLCGGQSADPVLIAAALTKQGITKFIFKLDSVGQFDTDFSVYIHQTQIYKLDKAAFEAANINGPDPAVQSRKALQDASEKMAKLSDGEGIKVAKCHADGTATVKVVSPKDFVDGKALE